MKSREEIKKILEEQFYESILSFHINALRCIYDARGFLKERRAIINKAVSSVIVGNESRKFEEKSRRVLEQLYEDIRDLHLSALREAIGLNAFQKRKKKIINNTLDGLNVLLQV